MLTIFKAWSLPINIEPLEMDSYVWNHSQQGVMFLVAPESINQILVSFILSSETVTILLYKTSLSSKVLATRPWGFDELGVNLRIN
jgi:hypothetical protein